MKKIFKFLKIACITIVSIIVLFLLIVYIGHRFIFKPETSDKPTIADIKADGFCFGAGCQTQAKTTEEYIKIFAQQIKIYNTLAPQLWPNNAVTGQSVVVESIEHDQSWLIGPDGSFKTIDKEKLETIVPSRPRFSVGFAPIDNGTINGIYLALSEADLKNVLSFQKYPHLGNYDLFITYSHELFHIKEQDKKWVKPDVVKNSKRSERLEDLDARAKRQLMYQQILSAVATTDSVQKKQMALEAIATFNEYKQSSKDDYYNSQYFDRIEGTAFYYELISSLYSAYPQQVKSPETLNKALTVLAKNLNTYEDVGVVIEGYWLGGWTCVLLDQLYADNKDEWKKQLMQSSNASPLQLLTDKLSNETLPQAKSITQQDKDKITQVIKSIDGGSRAKNVFKFLYEMIF